MRKLNMTDLVCQHPSGYWGIPPCHHVCGQPPTHFFPDRYGRWTPRPALRCDKHRWPGMLTIPAKVIQQAWGESEGIGVWPHPSEIWRAAYAHLISREEKRIASLSYP